MKNRSALLLLLLLYSSLFAQQYDNIWLIGRKTPPGLNDSDTQISFSTNPPHVSLDEDKETLLGPGGATISNEEGDLQFFTNGYQVANRELEVMPNGDSLCFEYYAPALGTKHGSPYAQSAIALPWPGHPGQYYVFHYNHTGGGTNYGRSTHLLCSRVDMALDNGLGDVADKNTILIEDSLQTRGLTAVKHANGRDWWVLAFQWKSGKYYKLLLTAGGTVMAGTGNIGTSNFYLYNSACFSPDGSRFSMVAWDSGPQQYAAVLDFDRATGTLSNLRKVNFGVFPNSPSWGRSVAFSPNSRLLYIFEDLRVFQVDLASPDLSSSLARVAEYDGFVSYYPTSFGLSQIGPDGRIYINDLAFANDYYHVMEQPNEPGLGCKLVQHEMKLMGIHGWHMPYHPNYRLGPLEGSPADTLGIEKAVYILAHPYPFEACVGGEAHFEATAFGTGRSFQWQSSNDGGSTWSDVQPGPHFSNTSTEYLSLHDIPASFDSMMFRCVATGNISTEVSRPATLTLIAAAPTAAMGIEQDRDSLYFINLSHGAQFAQWYYGDGDSTSNASTQHLYLKDGTYTATLVATNACGQDTATQVVTITPLHADFTADKTHGCAPLTVTFSGKDLDYRTKNVQYFSYNDQGTYIGGASATKTYTVPGIYHVRQFVYGPGPQAADTLKVGYITVLQGTNPAAPIESMQDGATVSLNCPFNLADSYTWYFSNGDTLNGQMAEYTFDSPGTYQVVLETANQCGTALDTVEFSVGSLNVDFTAEKTAGCGPFTAQYHNWTQYAGAELEWHFPAGLPTSSNEENPLVVYKNPGQYNVTLIAHAGGLSDTLKKENYIEVLADECPNPQVFAQINGLEITVWTDCQGSNSSYYWDMGNGNYFSTEAIIYQYPVGGTYEITLTILGQCGTASTALQVKVDGPSSVIDEERTGNIRLVPNPASNTVYLLSGRVFTKGASFRLANALGETVLKLEKDYWSKREPLNLSSLSSGIYFYNFEAPGGLRQVGKLVVE